MIKSRNRNIFITVQTDELYPYYTVMGLYGCPATVLCGIYKGQFLSETDAVRLLGMTGRVTVFFLFYKSQFCNHHFQILHLTADSC